MLVFVNSPVPLDLFQKPFPLWKVYVTKKNSFFGGFLSKSYLTGKYIADKWVVTAPSVLEGVVTDLTDFSSHPGLTKKAGRIHNFQRGTHQPWGGGIYHHVPM